MNQINIIGMGQDKKDLTKKHLDLIKACDVLIGGEHYLEMFDSLDVQKVPIKAGLDTLIAFIKQMMGKKKIVVLASGDPLFYGIGSTLVKHIDKNHLNIYSNISSVSAAFAAIKEPWHDAEIISLHGKQKKSFVFSRLKQMNKIAFLTDPVKGPYFIAEGLIKADMSDFRFCVLENLGSRDKEKITWFDDINLVRKQNFKHPNIVILQKPEKKTFPHETHIGMDDSSFKHSKGLITKSEIRSITLSKLKFSRDDLVFWDIGAGSGSVGIEASFLIPEGFVYCLEKHAERILDIKHNIKKFNCTNIRAIHTSFPEGLDSLELNPPDRIFIGGGGKNLDKILEKSCDSLSSSGIIVINTVLLQSLDLALKVLKKRRFNPSIVQVQVSRSRKMPFGHRLESLNPVWIISGSAPEHRQES